MTSLFRAAIISTGLLSIPLGAQATDTEFLQSLEGNWIGTGIIKLRSSTPAVRVTCEFNSDAPVEGFNLEGNCRGLVVVTRAISASLRVEGATYTGSYVGAGTGTAGLAGRRDGDTVDLAIRWAKEVNGDRKAMLRLRKTAGGMTITTIDNDLATGKEVVTSEINLKRP